MKASGNDGEWCIKQGKAAGELNGEGQWWLWVQTAQPVSTGLAQSQPSVWVPPLTSGQ